MEEHRHTVLVVDDDQGVREALEALFVASGLAVLTANEGGEALACLRGGVRPCVILLDLMMPGMDGWTFRDTQVADPLLEHIPVIVLSAYERSFSAGDWRGTAVVLGKPVDPDELVRLVAKHCGTS